MNAQSSHCFENRRLGPAPSQAWPDQNSTSGPRTPSRSRSPRRLLRATDRLSGLARARHRPTLDRWRCDRRRPVRSAPPAPQASETFDGKMWSARAEADHVLGCADGRPICLGRHHARARREENGSAALGGREALSTHSEPDRRILRPGQRASTRTVAPATRGTRHALQRRGKLELPRSHGADSSRLTRAMWMDNPRRAGRRSIDPRASARGRVWSAAVAASARHRRSRREPVTSLGRLGLRSVGMATVCRGASLVERGGVSLSTEHDNARLLRTTARSRRSTTALPLGCHPGCAQLRTVAHLTPREI